MKKRMLITSIVMVVVLAVALTTSSLAWFTVGQNNVQATGGTFKAAQTDSSSVYIAISDSLGNFRSNVELAKKDLAMQPVCPTAAIGSTITDLVFNTRKIVGDRFDLTTVEQLGNQTMKFDKSKDETEATDLSYYYLDTLYVVNYDAENLDSLTLKIESKVTAAEGYSKATPFMLVRLAKRGKDANAWTEISNSVVKLDTAAGGYCYYNFADLTASTDNASVSNQTRSEVEENRGNVTLSTPQTSSTYDQVASLNFSNLDLAATSGEYLKIDIVMWYDGAALDANTQQTSVAFMMTVTGA